MCTDDVETSEDVKALLCIEKEQGIRRDRPSCTGKSDLRMIYDEKWTE